MWLKLPLLLIFVLSAVWGAIGCARALRKIRAPRKYKDMLFTWAAHAYPGYVHEFIPWIATSIHWIAVNLLGAIVFGMILLAPLDPDKIRLLPGIDASLSFLLLMVVAAMVGSMWGGSLFIPVAERLSGDRHTAVSSEGWIYGSRLISWRAYTHFSLDSANRVINLWSASFPGTLGSALEFDSEQDMSVVQGIIQGHLPSGEKPSPGILRQYAAPILMAALCLPFAVFAFLMLLVPAGIGLVVNGILMFILMLLGTKLIDHLVGAGKMRPASLEP